MRSSIIFFAFLLCSSICQAQTPKLLESTGKIPQEFISSSTTKYKKQVTLLEKENKRTNDRKDTKNKKQFLLESNFEIDNILQSGLVLFNDPASQYVNKVLSKLPSKGGKGNKKKPRVYVLNSPAVNAFATDQGIIFVTLGLLANLENEAQLAFILCHELIHFYHNHSIDKFVHSKNVQRGKNDFNFSKNKGNLSINQQLFKESLYSRKIEEEADTEGFEIFKETNYDPSTIPDVFRILYYAYLPFDDKPFKKTFFEDPHYIFPSDRWMTKMNEIEEMEEKEDKNSSHPASAKRLAKIEEEIDGQNFGNKELYIVGEKEFQLIQDKAKYQIPFLNLYNGNYPEAIYTASLILEENGDDMELRKVVGKSLYMHAKHLNDAEQRNESISKRFENIAEEIQGESQQVYNLLAKMNHEEAVVLAVKYNWDLHVEKPKDVEIQGVVEDLFIEFSSIFKDLKKFATSPSAKKVDGTKEESKKEEESKNEKKSSRKSKHEKIKSTSKKPAYWKYAFIDVIKDEDFKKAFTKGKKEHTKRKNKAESYDTASGRAKLNKEYKKEIKKGQALGVKKVVVVNPYYLSISQKGNKANQVEYIRSEEKQSMFNKHLTDVAKNSKIKAEVLDMNKLRTSDIEKFNDIAKANQYFSQQMDQYDFSLTPGYQQYEMNQMAKKYGTDYFLWTGVISLEEKNARAWLWVGASVFAPYFLPLTVYNAVTPNYDMFYFAILYDVTTGRRSILKGKRQKSRQ